MSNNRSIFVTFCHNYSEAIFIIKNGKENLAAISIKAYEDMNNRFELYGLTKEGMEDIVNSDTRSFSEAISSIRGIRCIW